MRSDRTEPVPARTSEPSRSALNDGAELLQKLTARPIDVRQRPLALKKWDLQGERLIFPQDGEHFLRYKLKEIDTYLELDKLAKIAERHGNEVFFEVYKTLTHFAGIYNHAAIHLLRSLGQQFDLPKPEYNHFHRQHVTPAGRKVIEGS